MGISSREVIEKALSFPGVIAGMADLESIRSGPSHRSPPVDDWSPALTSSKPRIDWPSSDASVLVIGVPHPADQLQLDWWDGRNSSGNRQLMVTADTLCEWLITEQNIGARSLPYYVEHGGLYVKDAAVLAGLGVIGRSNLVLTPHHGPRIRFRAILIEGSFEPTGMLDDFDPCSSCGDLCHGACPRDAFPDGEYWRPPCRVQIESDVSAGTPSPPSLSPRNENVLVKFCRECELICPAG